MSELFLAERKGQREIYLWLFSNRPVPMSLYVFLFLSGLTFLNSLEGWHCGEDGWSTRTDVIRELGQFFGLSFQKWRESDLFLVTKNEHHEIYFWLHSNYPAQRRWFVFFFCYRSWPFELFWKADWKAEEGSHLRKCVCARAICSSPLRFWFAKVTSEFGRGIWLNPYKA